MNSQDLLIVDGYNILSSWNLNASTHNLEAARFDLQELLANYSGYMGMDIILVYDAHSSFETSKSKKLHKLETMYTKFGETADTKIECMLAAKLRRYRYVYVATADYALQLFALGCGALRITPLELKSMINSKTKG